MRYQWDYELVLYLIGFIQMYFIARGVLLLLISGTLGIPNVSHEVRECRVAVKEFVGKYTTNGCERVLPYRINLRDLLSECQNGSEDIRVVFAKMKHIGEAAFSGSGACPTGDIARHGTVGTEQEEEGLPPPPSPSPP